MVRFSGVDEIEAPPRASPYPIFSREFSIESCQVVERYFSASMGVPKYAASTRDKSPTIVISLRIECQAYPQCNEGQCWTSLECTLEAYNLQDP